MNVPPDENGVEVRCQGQEESLRERYKHDL